MKMQIAPDSALVRRDLPTSLWPLWLALRPQMTHSGEPLSLCPKPAYLHESIARGEQRDLQRVALQMAEARAAGVTPLWQLMLGEIGVLLKAGHFDAIDGLLDALRAEAGFADSLGRPASPKGRSLIGQHPLWLLAHIAIERGAPPSVLAHLFDVGLTRRLAIEPQEGSLLLLNAIIEGHKAAVSELQKMGVTLAPQEQGALCEAIEALPNELTKLLLSEGCNRLTAADKVEWLATLAENLRLPAKQKETLRLQSKRLVQRVDGQSPLMRRLTGRISAMQQQEVALPKRQTGVFWRRS